MSYIYLVTNKINGKQYVGQHKFNGIGMDNKYIGSGVLLHKAYKKYGFENFTIELLEECNDEDLNPLEQLYIEHYNTLSPNGYNLTKGGDGHFGYVTPDYVKLKISQSLKGFEFTEDRRKNISNALVGVIPWNKGKTNVYDNETKLKISESLKNNPKISKKVYQYDKDFIFISDYPSASEAHRKTNIKVSHIIECCNNKRKTAGGYIWKYDETKKAA